MYTWSCSEQSINTLKAISPRKGNKDNYFYQNGGSGKEDSATEEKIAQILFEAQKQMQAKGGRHIHDGYSASSPSGSARSDGSEESPMSPMSNRQQNCRTRPHLDGNQAWVKQTLPNT